ncbi:MAG: flavin reductase family protein [Bacteroidota bacterium]|nr:flavin reductase family protein [Bacteroidota bacterium]
MKIPWKPGTLIYPLPAVMVSCGANEKENNIITIAWTGTTCTNPPMCYISVRKERHSYDIIKKNMEFVINLTTKDLAYATDWCGVRSGKDYNKFKEMKLTPEKGQIVKAPLIKESPLNIECKVKDIIELGSHDMFLAEVVAVNADEKHYEKNSSKFHFNHTQPICYSHGKYFSIGEKIGKFGFSVMKKRRKKKQ